MTKLTSSNVNTIRQRRHHGESLRKIAADYGVNLGTIHHIATRKTWRHVP